MVSYDSQIFLKIDTNFKDTLHPKNNKINKKYHSESFLFFIFETPNRNYVDCIFGMFCDQ